MNSASERMVGGKFRLSQRGFVLDDEEKFRVHDGLDIEKNTRVKVLIASEEVPLSKIDLLTTYFLHSDVRALERGGAEQKNYVVFSYIDDETFEEIYGNWEKEIEPGIHEIRFPPALPPSRQQPIPIRKQTRTTSQEAWRKWYAALAIGIVILILVISSRPILMALIPTATPTPTLTPTVTPTPQIFTFAVDTTVQNFITGEAFVIPKKSKVILVDGAHTKCEVLADWNGTQIIISAKVIFPKRNCP